MTNEEKASEIVIKIQNSSSLDYDSRRAKYMYDSAMEMAQWKDERIKELEVTLNCRSKYERIYRDEFLKAEKEALINKACEWWENELTCPTMTQADIDDFVLGRIKEFKRAMKGGE